MRTLLALTLISLACGSAAAQSHEVVELFECGTEAYRAGRYEEAADLFARAHEIEAVPDLTYNLARSLENLGRHAEAAVAYRRYLVESPDAEDRLGIEERIHTLEARETERQRLADERDRLLAERARLGTQSGSTSGDGGGPWPWIV